MPFLDKQFRSIAAGASVLMVGSEGEIPILLKRYAKEYNFNVITTDIDPNRNPDLVADFCDVKNPFPQQYDYIILAEVLEHFHDPKQAVVTTINSLKPNGQVIATVPFLFPIHERPIDYYRYTKYGLALLFKQFTHVTILERNLWPEALLTLLVRLIMEKNIRLKLLGALLVPICLLLMPFAHIVGKLFPGDFLTTGYVVTAQKP